MSVKFIYLIIVQVTLLNMEVKIHKIYWEQGLSIHKGIMIIDITVRYLITWSSQYY